MESPRPDTSSGNARRFASPRGASLCDMELPSFNNASISHARRTSTLLGAVAGMACIGVPRTAPAQTPDTLPFNVGERMVYRARVAGVGTVGRGAMWIEGPVMVRGVQTWLLRFDMTAGFGPVRASDRTSSWLDPARMTALRYAKRERSPVTNHQEAVDIYAEERIWRSATGDSAATPSLQSLDELSFIYYIRTLPLAPSAIYRLDQHFDAARNPTSITVVRRERITTGAGVFNTVLVEMRVRDSRRYRDVGVIRISLSDDRCRVPVRIASSLRVLGTVVLTLESYESAKPGCPESLLAGTPDR